MNIFSSKWLLAGIFLITAIALLAAGCGGSSGTSVPPQVKVRTLSGTVLAPTSTNAGVRMAGSMTPVMGAKVWLEGYSDITPLYTDASGSYIFIGVPAAEHFVVASFEIGNVVHKQRVRADVRNDSVDTAAPTISLEEAKTVLTGVLRDTSGIISLPEPR